MCLPGQNILSILEIVFYSPAVIVSIFLCRRHSFSPNAGFIFLFFFSLLRIAGAALDLATIQFSSSKGILDTVALAVSFTGVSPLMLTALGLLYCIRFRMIRIYPTMLKPLHLILLRVPVMAALVLCDKGAVSYGLLRGKKGVYVVDVLSMVGTMIFLVVIVATTAATFVLLTLRHRFHKSQQRLLYTVAASLPFLTTRIIYSFLGAFSSIQAFRFLDGSLTALGCMSILPEMVTVIMYTGVGFFIPPIPKIIKAAKSKDSNTRSKSKSKPTPTREKARPWKSYPKPSEKQKKKTATVRVRAIPSGQEDLDQVSTVGTVDGRHPALRPKNNYRTSRLNGPLGDHELGLLTGSTVQNSNSLRSNEYDSPNTYDDSNSNSNSNDSSHSSNNSNDHITPNPRTSTHTHHNISRSSIHTRHSSSYRKPRPHSHTLLGDQFSDLEHNFPSFSQGNLHEDDQHARKEKGEEEEEGEEEIDDHRASIRAIVDGSNPEIRPERSWRKSNLDDVELDKHASVDLSTLFRAQVGRAE